MGATAFAKLLATWFGAGLAPKAPGTWGSVAALPFAWAIQSWGGSAALVLAASLLFLAGWLASNRLVNATGIKDPQIIGKTKANLERLRGGGTT